MEMEKVKQDDVIFAEEGPGHPQVLWRLLSAAWMSGDVPGIIPLAYNPDMGQGSSSWPPSTPS